MRIQRFYTVQGEDAYARVQFRTVDVSQVDATGEAGADEIVVPAAWSHIAAQAWYDHGCYRGPVPEQTLPVVEAKTPEWLLRREAPAGQTSHVVTETDCRQVFNRVAGGCCSGVGCGSGGGDWVSDIVLSFPFRQTN